MEYYKIEKSGRYIIVNILDGDRYIPLLIFTNLEYFGEWVKSVAEHCHQMVQLSEEIKRVCDPLVPKGEVWDYVNQLGDIDGVGKRCKSK